MYRISSMNGNTYLNIDVSGIPALKNLEGTPITQIRVSSYRKLSDSPNEQGEYVNGGGDDLLKIINDFFEYLPKETYETVVLHILNMRTLLYKAAKEGKTTLEICAILKPQVYALIVGKDLYFKALTFVETCVVIDYREDAGSRTHDTPDQTYHRNDLNQLYAMMLLCRVLLPIFSIIRDMTPVNVRDQIIMDITESSFSEACPEVVEKLERYILANMGDMKSKFKDQFLPMVFAGYTIDTLPDILYAGILSSVFIIQDLTKSLVYAILRHVRQVHKNPNATHIEIRTPSTFVDDDKSSDLEVNSTVSPTVFHIPKAASCFTESIAVEFMRVHGLTKKDVRQFSNHFHKKIYPNEITSFLISSLFYEDHLGYAGLLGLNIRAFEKLLAVVAAHCYQMRLYHLVELLCACPRPVRDISVCNNASLLYNYDKLDSFKDLVASVTKRSCSKYIGDQVAGKLAKLVTWYVEQEWVANPLDHLEGVSKPEITVGKILKLNLYHFGELFEYMKWHIDPPTKQE